MTNIALLYQDAINRETLRKQLRAIAKANPKPVITFDDAGAGAHTYMADDIEGSNLRGHFFVRTSRAGQQNFLQPAQIRDLHKRGHVIGIHLGLRPTRVSRSTLGDVIHEFSRSSSELAEILGVPARTASVPGGQYSSKLIRAAAIAGFETVFTAEPTLETDVVEGCTLRGRFTITRSTSTITAAALAYGAFLPRLSQSIFWHLKRPLELTSLVPQLHRHG